MANRSQRNRYLTLSEITDTNPILAFDPPGLWASVQPVADGFGEKRISARVETDWHPQVSFNTVMTDDDSQQWYVKGIQRVNDGRDTMVLNCEMVETPQ